MLSKQQIITVGAEHDLTATQSLTLIITDNNNPRPMNSLATIFGCDASNITGIIDGLEQKNLIVRTESKADRRKKVIMLTEVGLAKRKEIFSEAVRKYEALFDNLDKRDVEVFTRVLAQITNECPNKVA